MLKERIEIVERCGARLHEEFDFRLDFRNNDLAVFERGDVRIEIEIVDVREVEFAMRVVDQASNPEKVYEPFYMLGCRQPEIQSKSSVGSDDPATRPVDDQIASAVSKLANALCDYFPDVLRGDFQQIQLKDGYDEFVSEVKRLATGPLWELDFSDPIVTKYFECDWSWVTDLKGRIGEK